jgi:hypothetical protein
MSRFASALNEAAAAGNSVKLFVACDLDFASGHVRAHDGIGSISWGGDSYDGLGKFGGIEVADESIDLIARPLKLTLSGVPEASLPAPLVATALDEVYQGRSAILYLGLWNDTTGALIDTPEILWEGFMDHMIVTLAEGSGAIALNCEHRLRREPRIARYTDADQQLAYSGDRFFDLVPKIAGFKGKWGSKDIPEWFSRVPRINSNWASDFVNRNR